MKHININVLYASIFLNILIFTSFSNIFYVGPIGSDDITYINLAREIAEENYVPNTHWGFRYTLLVPLSLLASQSNIEQVIYWFNLSITLGLFSYAFYLYWKSLDKNSRLNIIWLPLITGTAPFFVIQSSILNVDIIEAFLGLFAVYHAQAYIDKKKILDLIITSLLLGLLILTRETGVLFCVSLAICYLLTVKKLDYKFLVIAAIFPSIFLITEGAYYYFNNGDFFYHINTVMQSHLKGSVGDMYAKHGAVTGNLLPGTMFEPFTVLLFNQEFGIIFIIFLLLLFYSLKFKNLPFPVNRLLIYFLIIFFLVISFSSVVRLLPRYYAVLYLIVLFLVHQLSSEMKWTQKITTYSVIFVTNMICLLVENINPIYHNINYLEISKTHLCVYAEKNVTGRALSMASLNKEKVNFKKITDCEAKYAYIIDGQKITRESVSYLLDTKKFNVVERFKSPKLPLGNLLDLAGLNEVLPDQIYHWLAYRNPSATLYLLEK